MTKIMVVSEHSTTHMEAAALHNCVFDERHLVVQTGGNTAEHMDE